VDRPLTQPRHWRRAVGRLVEVPVSGVPLTARVTGADAAGVQFDVSGTARAVSYAELGSGRVQIEFNRSADEDD
jgi:ribosome maturation factor RimP